LRRLCPSGLRDWSNTPYHPLLDWRLAADLLEILAHGVIKRFASVIAQRRVTRRAAIACAMSPAPMIVISKPCPPRWLDRASRIARNWLYS
jgi:hypothetical protein